MRKTKASHIDRQEIKNAKMFTRLKIFVQENEQKENILIDYIGQLFNEVGENNIFGTKFLLKEECLIILEPFALFTKEESKKAKAEAEAFGTSITSLDFSESLPTADDLKKLLNRKLYASTEGHLAFKPSSQEDRKYLESRVKRSQMTFPAITTLTCAKPSTKISCSLVIKYIKIVKLVEENSDLLLLFKDKTVDEFISLWDKTPNERAKLSIDINLKWFQKPYFQIVEKLDKQWIEIHKQQLDEAIEFHSNMTQMLLEHQNLASAFLSVSEPLYRKHVSLSELARLNRIEFNCYSPNEWTHYAFQLNEPKKSDILDQLLFSQRHNLENWVINTDSNDQIPLYQYITDKGYQLCHYMLYQRSTTLRQVETIQQSIAERQQAAIHKIRNNHFYTIEPEKIEHYKRLLKAKFAPDTTFYAAVQKALDDYASNYLIKDAVGHATVRWLTPADRANAYNLLYPSVITQNQNNLGASLQICREKQYADNGLFKSRPLTQIVTDLQAGLNQIDTDRYNFNQQRQQALVDCARNEALLTEVLLDFEIYADLNAEELTLLFTQGNKALMIEILVYAHEEGYKAFTYQGTTITYQYLLNLVPLGPGDYDHVNAQRVKVNIPQAIPVGARYAGFDPNEMTLSKELLYQLTEDDLVVGETELKKQFRHKILNMQSTYNLDSKKTQFILVPIMQAGALLLDPSLPNLKRQPYYSFFADFCEKLRELVELIPAGSNHIIVGIANLTGNHYIPYFIHRQANQTLQVITVDPSVKTSPILSLVFNYIFPNCQFHDPEIIQQLRERDCGINSLQTIADALDNKRQAIRLQNDRLLIDPAKLTVNGEPFAGYDYARHENYYLASFVQHCKKVRLKWQKKLSKYKSVHYGVDIPPQPYSFRQNVEQQNTQDSLDELLNIIAGLLMESDYFDEVETHYLNTLQPPTTTQIEGMRNQVKSQLSGLIDNPDEFPPDKKIDDYIEAIFRKHLVEHRVTALQNCFNTFVKRHDINFDSDPALLCEDFFNVDHYAEVCNSLKPEDIKTFKTWTKTRVLELIAEAQNTRVIQIANQYAIQQFDLIAYRSKPLKELIQAQINFETISEIPDSTIELDKLTEEQSTLFFETLNTKIRTDHQQLVSKLSEAKQQAEEHERLISNLQKVLPEASCNSLFSISLDEFSEKHHDYTLDFHQTCLETARQIFNSKAYKRGSIEPNSYTMLIRTQLLQLLNLGDQYYYLSSAKANECDIAIANELMSDIREFNPNPEVRVFAASGKLPNTYRQTLSFNILYECLQWWRKQIESCWDKENHISPIYIGLIIFLNRVANQSDTNFAVRLADRCTNLDPNNALYYTRDLTPTQQFKLMIDSLTHSSAELNDELTISDLEALLSLYKNSDVQFTNKTKNYFEAHKDIEALTHRGLFKALHSRHGLSPSMQQLDGLIRNIRRRHEDFINDFNLDSFDLNLVTQLIVNNEEVKAGKSRASKHILEALEGIIQLPSEDHNLAMT